MAAAKRGKQATRGAVKKTLPAWVLIGIGILMGLALSLLVLFKDWMPSLRKHNQPQPNADATAPRESDPAVVDENGKAKDPKTPPAAPRKTYDFYSVLPEMEVVIPDAELTAKARSEAARQQAAAQAQASANAGQTPPSTATTPSTATAVDIGAQYLLQAGSYPDAKDADAQKAKLALLGITAKVQQVTINGKTWNRVRAGPYPTASALEATKKTLSDNGINAIAMKEIAGQ